MVRMRQYDGQLVHNTGASDGGNVMKFNVKFRKSGRGKAQCPPNPEYPHGCIVDMRGGKPGCRIPLPYPAPECGMWLI